MTQAARRRVLITATSAGFANFLAFLGLTPLYPNVAHDLGLGVDSLGVYFGISSAVGVVLQVPAGVIADRAGRRPLLLAGILFMGLGQVLRWQATTPLVFGLGQLAIGFCSPLVVAPAYALIADAFADGGRASAIGVLQAGINLGQVAGYLLAGLLGPFIGWRGYSLCLVLLPILLLPLALTVPEPPRAPSTDSIGRSTAAALRFLVLPAAGGLAVVAAITLGAGFSTGYLLPFAARSHGIGEGATSLLLVPYVVGSVAGAPSTGRWADRAGHRVPLAASLGAAALAVTAFALFGFSVPAVILCFFVIGAGVSSALAILAAGVAEVAVQVGAGTGAAMGGLRLGQQLGPATAPALVGLIYARSGFAPAYLALAVALVAGAVTSLAATSRSPRPAPGPAPT